MNYQEVVVVEDFEEAQQFRYEHNDEPVEINTPVGYEGTVNGEFGLICFDGIYFQDDE